MSKIAEITVSLDHLRDILGLPVDTHIEAMRVDRLDGKLRMLIEHPALPDVKDGELPPQAIAMISEVAPNKGRVWAKAKRILGTLLIDGVELRLIDTVVARRG